MNLCILNLIGVDIDKIVEADKLAHQWFILEDSAELRFVKKPVFFLKQAFGQDLTILSRETEEVVGGWPGNHIYMEL